MTGATGVPHGDRTDAAPRPGQGRAGSAPPVAAAASSAPDAAAAGTRPGAAPPGPPGADGRPPPAPDASAPAHAAPAPEPSTPPAPDAPAPADPAPAVGNPAPGPAASTSPAPGPAAGGAAPAGDGEPAPRLRTLVRQHALTLTLAFLGVLVSAVVAAVVSVYLGFWTGGKLPPGAPRLSAGAEVWWDLASDERVVVAPESATDRRGKTFQPQGPMGAMDELVAENGVNAGMMRVRIILNNFTQVPASITAIRLRVEGTRAVPSGPVYRCGGSQGSAEVSKVMLDLHRPDRAAVEVGDDGKGTAQYPSTQIQVAAQGDPAHFDVEVRGGSLTHDFVLVVVYEQGGEEHEIAVDDAGRRFRLAPRVDREVPSVRCDPSTSSWRSLGS